MTAPLCFPSRVLEQHVAVLGKTGAGKSSALRHVVEFLLARMKRVCVVDPKGDWWGLKTSADGKAAGFPVIAFGDFKNAKASDVPINAHSGKHVAELVATGNRPCVIGFRGWMPAAMTQFWIDFASTLFNSNHGELFLFIDEVHNFAPKGRVMDPAAGKSLHWCNRIMSEGRGIGLVCAIASQRPQKVHNDTLTCCETLVAMRVVHAADRQALKDWIDGCGDSTGNELLKNVAGLERGEAYVWSPEIGFGPQRVKFPMFSTFDSFAPPQLQRKISDSGWADVDLGAVKEKLAAVIEEAKANDPAELKRKIADLHRQLATRPAGAVPQPPVEVPVFTAQDREMLASLADNVGHQKGLLQTLNNLIPSTQRQIDTLLARVDQKAAGAERPRASMPARAPAPRPPSAIGDSGLDDPQQKILDVVAMLGVRGIDANRESVARWLDIHPNGGRYGSNLAYLRAEGYLDGFRLTEKGNAAAITMATGFEAAKAPLDGPQREIVDALNRDGHFTRETLATALGIHPNGGRYGSNLARLRTMGLIPDRGEIYLTDAAHR